MTPDGSILPDNEVALADAAFDQPPSRLDRLVVIAATARSGSYMLGRMLKQLGYGIPLEYYHGTYRDVFARRWGVEEGPAFRAEYLRALIRHRTTNGSCATKCMPTHLDALSEGLAACGPIPGLYHIHIWRRDSLAQAISLRLAYQSGLWNFTPGPTTRPIPDLDVFDLDALRLTVRRLVLHELRWRVHLRGCGTPVAHVAYEDLIADRDGTLRRLVAFLDPERAPTASLAVVEPATGEGLRARQHVSEEGRRALRASYEARFGMSPPLAEP